MRIRIRDLFIRYPALDRLRRSVLVAICNHGSSFFTNTYRITAFIPKAAKPYIKNIWAEDAEDKGGDKVPPAIFAIYHGRMCGLTGLRPRRKVTILISHSRDGEMIARAAQSLGFATARGSSAHGGMKGALEMVSAAKAGQRLSYTVDGPRGPRYQVKESIIRLAEMTSLPIIPFVCHARQTYWMESWDNFMAPWWGTPIVYLFGEPMHVPANLNKSNYEDLATELEDQLAHLRQLGACFY
ncbi:MAG TPA: DUF374 domain-containing protein [Candidatus Obscuribacterales bacterium]